MVTVTKGAAKFKSIRAMARTLAAKTNEPESRVYIRLWKRLNAGKMTTSQAFHAPARSYTMQATI